MKPLILTALLAAAAPQASAGDFHFDFGFGSHGSRVRIGLHGHRRHHRARTYCRRYWVPVRYETITHREWVPGYRTRVWYPERYETRYDHHGRRYRVIISRGYYGWHVVRGHYETRYERVRQGGYYEYTCTRRGHHHDHYRR